MGRCVATRADRHWSPSEANAFVNTSRLLGINIGSVSRGTSFRNMTDEFADNRTFTCGKVKRLSRQAPRFRKLASLA